MSQPPTYTAEPFNLITGTLAWFQALGYLVLECGVFICADLC